jgi:hypothetical protein
MKIFIRVIVTLVVVAMLMFLLTGLFDYLYIRFVVGAFSQGLQAVNWVNPHLGKAVIAFVSAIVALVTIEVFAVSFASIRRVLQWTLVIPLFLAAITHGIAAVATWGDIFDPLGHSDLFYGIDDQNRVKLFSRGGANPMTGDPLVAITPQNVREVEARRNNTPMEVRTPEPNSWFATGSGKPILWYSKRADGFHFFNMPGFDSSTATPLQPATLEIKASYEAEMSRKFSQDRQAQLKNLWNSGSPERAKVDVAMAIVLRGGTHEQSLLIDQRLPALIHAAAPNVQLTADLLLPAFVNDGYFEKAFNGDTSFLVDSGVFETTGRILLCKVTLVPPLKSEVEGVFTSQLTLNFRMIANDGSTVNTGTLRTVGPGLSEQASIDRAMEMLLDKNATQMFQSMKSTQ